MNLRRSLVVVLAVLMVAACGSARPILYSDNRTLTDGKAYAYRIPVGGCGTPIVTVNSRNWEPDKPWILPLPKGWKVTTEGGEKHQTSYLAGTVSVDGNRLIISLPNGTVVNRYHMTDKRRSYCA